MLVRLHTAKIAIIGAVMAFGATVGGTAAEARGHAAGHAHTSGASMHYAGAHFAHGTGVRGHLFARYASYGRLQCVPFARENTGIELSGNAATWWNNADGVYQRGARPEVGSVLNFRANGRMRMGHVAVVSNVVDARNIEIDHANWSGPGASPGGVSRNITVVDVSPANDWTAVRVSLGHTGEFGSVYPTFGFIYDRPDNGTLVANNSHAPAPVLNAAPRDLRPAADRLEIATVTQESEEVAEAAEDIPSRFHRTGHHGYLMRTTAHAGAYAHASSYGRNTYFPATYTHAGSHAHAASFSHAEPSRSTSHASVARVQMHGATHPSSTRHRT